MVPPACGRGEPEQCTLQTQTESVQSNAGAHAHQQGLQKKADRNSRVATVAGNAGCGKVWQASPHQLLLTSRMPQCRYSFVIHCRQIGSGRSKVQLSQLFGWGSMRARSSSGRALGQAAAAVQQRAVTWHHKLKQHRLGSTVWADTQ